MQDFNYFSLNNRIFDKLVPTLNDLFGIVAYALYKDHERKWLEDFKKEKNRPPNEIEVNSFILSEINHCETYRDKALPLLKVFIDTWFKNHTKEYSDTIAQNIEKQFIDYLQNQVTNIPHDILMKSIEHALIDKINQQKIDIDALHEKIDSIKIESDTTIFELPPLLKVSIILIVVSLLIISVKSLGII